MCVCVCDVCVCVCVCVMCVVGVYGMGIISPCPLYAFCLLTMLSFTSAEEHPSMKALLGGWGEGENREIKWVWWEGEEGIVRGTEEGERNIIPTQIIHRMAPIRDSNYTQITMNFRNLNLLTHTHTHTQMHHGYTH